MRLLPVELFWDRKLAAAVGADDAVAGLPGAILFLCGRRARSQEESSEIQTSSPYRWIVDPLDGTTNYAHGYPCFCVSIAVERDGSPLAGAVFDPLLGELFTATPGGGAFRNGE